MIAHEAPLKPRQHLFASHRPEQQSLPASHPPRVVSQHLPPLQLFTQQSLLEVQLVPFARHAEHVLVERQSSGAQHWLEPQTLPVTPQHRPPVHAPLQQSAPSAHAAPSVWQVGQ